MKDETSIFGAKPERLDRLVFEALRDSEAEESVPTASLGTVLERPGGQIGHYKLLSVLGEGGMGIVYLAEQQEPIRRKVALKLIKPGMDSKRVMARFEAERQALALLDHPNIAHVYDAGTTEAGRPYFVMEYVKGLSIIEYCDRHRLTIEDRLDLFRQTCFAVHHAHQKGIIHRDIKPSNILVTLQDGQAVPKIIDFGVAKAIAQPLTERTLATEESQLLGTPEYMSPEQADMASEDIDTRSDIYSLGVLLYVLLTGVLPFDSDTLRTGGIERIRQIIRETDPKTPSTRLTNLSKEAIKVAQNRGTDIGTLTKKLHKELEWIPLKAMRKERAERYRSASEFADDIENYLSGTPLVAGPLSTMYRLRKFVQRNRALVTGVLVVAASLTVGLIVSSGLYYRAERLRIDAEYARHDADRAAAESKELAEKETAARAEAERARDEAQAVTDFLKDILLLARGITGREATVVDVLDAAAAGLEEMFKDRPLIEADIQMILGGTYSSLGYFGRSVSPKERAHHIYLEQLGPEHGKTRKAANVLAISHNFGGNYREAEKIWDHPGPGLSIAVAYSHQGRYAEAERVFAEVWKRKGWDPNHIQTTYSWDLAKVYREQGRYEKAKELFIRTLDAQRKRFGDKGDPVNRSRTRCMNELARLYVILELYDEAEDLFTEGIAFDERTLPGKDHPYTLRHINGLGVLRTKQGRFKEAEILFSRALAGRKLKLGGNHPYTLETINDLGLLRRAQKHYQDAEKLITEALEGRRAKLGPDHPYTLQSIHELAVLYKEQGVYDKAELLLLKALEGHRIKLADTHPHTQESIKTLIKLYEAWGKPKQAEQLRAKLSKTENMR